MRLFGKRVGTLEEADILALLSDAVPESRTLEYKRELPGATEGEKKEFMADVSALANTDGGVIIYGIETLRDGNRDTGMPIAVRGVQVPFDSERQRLLAMLQTGLEPSLTAGIELQQVAISSQSIAVLALGVAGSFLRPHRVVAQNSNRFWRRSPSGKYEPDSTELRTMFMESASWVEECEQFRQQRLGILSANKLVGRSMFVVDLLPLGRLREFRDIRVLDGRPDLFRPFATDLSEFRFNADGFFAFYRLREGITNYTQVFRFGGVEGYSFRFVQPDSRGRMIFHAGWATAQLEAFVTSSMSALRDVIGVEPPFCLLVSIRGLLGAGIVVKNENELFFSGDDKRFDTDELLLPPAVLEHDSDLAAVCEPLWDIVWQAAGHSGRPTPKR